MKNEEWLCSLSQRAAGIPLAVVLETTRFRLIAMQNYCPQKLKARKKPLLNFLLSFTLKDR